MRERNTGVLFTEHSMDVVFAGGGEEESWELSLLFDAMAKRWPLPCTFTYTNYAYMDTNGIPAFYPGTNMG